MSESMEFAKGLAGLPPTGSPYNSAGLAFREVTHIAEQSAGEEYKSKRGYSPSGKVNETSGEGMGVMDHYDFPERTAFEGKRFEGEVGKMRDGDIAWATPWSVRKGKEDTYWIDKAVTVDKEQGGTVQIDLARIGDCYFVSAEDLAAYGDDFSTVNEEAGKEDLIRLFSSDDEAVMREVREKASKIKDSRLLAAVRDWLSAHKK